MNFYDISVYDAIRGFQYSQFLFNWLKRNKYLCFPRSSFKFFVTRPSQINLNVAVGEEDQIITLFEVSQDSSSTISPKVKEFILSDNKQKLVGITMKQLCERYYYKKILLLIQIFKDADLLTNNWNNGRCLPDVFNSQINEQIVKFEFLLPQVTLPDVGYKKWPSNYGLNQISIRQSVYEQSQKNIMKVKHILYAKNSLLSV